MRLPPHVVAYPDLDLFVWQPRGVLDETAVNTIVRFLGYQEAVSEKPIDRFTDTTFLEAVDLNLRYVFRVALYRRLTYDGLPGAKSAILVNDQKAAHYFKFHALLTDHAALRVRTFEQREAAARWLGVTDAALEIAGSNGPESEAKN